METFDLLLEQFKWENLGEKSLLCELTESGTLWPLRGLGDFGFHGPGGGYRTEELHCGRDLRPEEYSEYI